MGENLMGEERRKQILNLIKENKEPLNGTAISKIVGVSRQVIVQDIALLRANNNDIISTNRGYIINNTIDDDSHTRVFKVAHTDEQIFEELSLIVNLSGKVIDVYVEHEIYGKVSADLDISNQKDIEKFMLQMQNETATPLKNITNNHHYHTIKAPTKKLLDLIEQELNEKGFLCEDNL